MMQPDSDQPQNYQETHFDTNATEMSKNSVSFNDSVVIHNNSLNSPSNPDNEILKSDNSVQLVQVKIMDEPAKEIPKTVNLSASKDDSMCKNNSNDSKYSNNDIIVENFSQHPCVIKVKVKVINQNKTDKDIDQINNSDNKIENFNRSLTKTEDPIIPEAKFLNSSVEKHDVDKTCIFHENKIRPLSPISKCSPEKTHFTNVDDLVQFHERVIRKSPPKMGTNALLRESKTKLNDSEIISALVRDRFVVNMYESRSFHRNIRKPSTYGRIFRSLERAVMRNDAKDNLFNNDIVAIKRNSPIKFKDQIVSLPTQKTTESQQNNLFNNDVITSVKIYNTVLPQTTQKITDNLHQKYSEQNSHDNKIASDLFTVKDSVSLQTQKTNESWFQINSQQNLTTNEIIGNSAKASNDTLSQITQQTSENLFHKNSHHDLVSNEIIVGNPAKVNNDVISQTTNEILLRKKSQPNLSTDEIISCPIKVTGDFVSLQTKQRTIEHQCEQNLFNNEISSPVGLSDQTIYSQGAENISFDKNVSTSTIACTQNHSTEILCCKNNLATLSSEYGSGSNSLEILGEKNEFVMTSSEYGSLEKHLCDKTFVSDVSSYNMEEFLEKALGDELNNLNSTETDSKITTTQSKLLQEESICTSNASDLISKINTLQSHICRSFTKGFQQMTGTLRQSQSSQNTNSVKSDLDSLFLNNEEMAVLLKQAAVQYEALKQISKALTLCRNSKEFCVSNEQVEGERLLLIATYKRQLILDEIRRLEYSTDPVSPISETGSLTITNISLPLKASSPVGPRDRDLTKWYVAVFSSGLQVFATKATLAAADGIVKFEEKVAFENLPTNFEINVEIHCLLQRKPGRNFSHESKYHINKDAKRSRCPTPKKFLTREKSIQKLSTRCDTGIRTSSFKLCGSLKLSVYDLTKTAPWDLRGKIPLCSSLSGIITLNLNSSVRIPVKQAGFLTVGSELRGCASWNRRWCVLDGHMFRYWNYPSAEETSEPTKEIDLKYCVSSKIQIADRSLCARPRTLLLEIARKPKPEDFDSMMLACVGPYTIERYYLSADCNSDLNIWQQQLDEVVHALRVWNVGFLL